MKKVWIIAVLAALLIGFDSCQKHKYCQCYAYIDGEDVPLGDDIDLSELVADSIEALSPKYNVYIIESGTCDDKEKEIVGWGRVNCVEVSPKFDTSWFTNLFNNNKKN